MSEFSTDDDGDVFVSITNAGLDGDLDSTIPILGIAFAAFCVWLTVRILNRRERWAKRTAIVLFSLPAIYLASFWPACWLVGKDILEIPLVAGAYRPIVRTISDKPLWVRNAIAFGSDDLDESITWLELSLLFENVSISTGPMIAPAGP